VTTAGQPLQDAVRAVLAGYEVPTAVHEVDALPLPPVGKVLRRALREPLRADGPQS
jgi:acyl-CoA synthetase (AMP-forming)/AMP-acid ligase II